MRILKKLRFFFLICYHFSLIHLTQRRSNFFKLSKKYFFWTSSFDLDCCPASDFFKFINKKKSQRANSGEYKDGTEILSLIRPI